MSDQPLLQVKALSKTFGGLKAVSDLTFHVNEGEILGLIGPNGAGKSTTFDLMTGVTRPETGQVIYRGRDITGMKPHEVNLLGISRTFQKVRLFPSMSALDNVLVCTLVRHPKPVARRLAAEALERVGLGGSAHRVTAELNLVDRKRVEMARALGAEAKLIFLDEVMCGLNAEEIDVALQLVQTVRRSGVTLIVVEHVMKVVMSLSDRLIVLDHGELIATGLPQEIRENDRVIEAYLGARFKKNQKVGNGGAAR